MYLYFSANTFGFPSTLSCSCPAGVSFGCRWVLLLSGLCWPSSSSEAGITSRQVKVADSTHTDSLLCHVVSSKMSLDVQLTQWSYCEGWGDSYPLSAHGMGIHTWTAPAVSAAQQKPPLSSPALLWVQHKAHEMADLKERLVLLSD